jgi:hypothetical protein
MRAHRLSSALGSRPSWRYRSGRRVRLLLPRSLPNRQHRRFLPESWPVTYVMSLEKCRLRLINLEHLSALDAAEISNALHNSGSFSGALAAGTGHLLHDGRIHPHPSRPRSHHDPSASDPRSTDLSPQSLRHAWPETRIGVFCGGQKGKPGLDFTARRPDRTTTRPASKVSPVIVELGSSPGAWRVGERS